MWSGAGKLAQHGMGPMTLSFVSKYADTALEWLEDTTVRNELKRFVRLANPCHAWWHSATSQACTSTRAAPWSAVAPSHHRIIAS